MSRATWVMLAITALAAVVTGITVGTHSHYETRHFLAVHVLETGVDGYHYKLAAREVTDSGEQPENTFWTHFCEDYEPTFDAGEILTVLNVRDYGDCWDLKDVHPRYMFLRDDKGRIIREATP